MTVTEEKVNIRLKVPLKGKSRIHRLLQYYNTSWGWELSPMYLTLGAEFYYQYVQLKKSGMDEESIKTIIFSKENKAKVRKNTNTSYASLGNCLTKFRKVGIITKGSLAKYYIPLSVLDDNFIFQITFNSGI